MLQEILGKMLYTEPVDPGRDQLPSPEDLKYKVILNNVENLVTL